MPKVGTTCATAQRLMLEILHNTKTGVEKEIYQLEKREVVGSDLTELEHQRLVKLRSYQAAMQLVHGYYCMEH
jgi:hypothetical protein